MRLSTKFPDRYFASLDDEKDLAAACWDKVTDFYTRMQSRVYYLRAAESARMYYGLPTGADPFDVSQIASGGPTGSHSLIKINHYYSLGQGLVTMATSDRPDWLPVPANGNASSYQDQQLAKDLLNYYLWATSYESLLRQAVESAVVMQDGYLLIGWNPRAGPQLHPDIPGDPETGLDTLPARYQGDIRMAALTPFDVVVDLDWLGAGERPWVITREFVNKWDLAAQYPAYHDEIVRQRGDRTDDGGLQPIYTAGTMYGEAYQIDEDQCTVFTLWHRKTPAVPSGKMVVFVSDKACLFNGGLPYGDSLPLHRVSPARVAGSTLGHSPMINLIAVQKAISAAWSAPVTNLSLYGAGSLLIPKGAGLDVTDLGGGASGIEFDPAGGKPEVLQVPGINQAAIEMAKELVRTAELISGVAPVVRGNASPQLSGTAQALQLQTAIQYASGLVQDTTKLIEASGDAIIKILQQYATSPRLALIVGKAKTPFLREFSNRDLQGVARITVRRGNALSKTPAAAVDMANNLLQQGRLTTQQYFTVVDTGTLEPELAAPATQQILIKQENEALAAVRFATPEEVQGYAFRAQAGESTDDLDVTEVLGPDGHLVYLVGVPPALATDNHAWHIEEHPSVLNTPAMRKNVAAILAVNYHLGQHKGFGLAADGGIPVLPPPGSPPPGMDPNPPPAPPIDPNANGGGPGPDGGAPPPAPTQQGPGGAAGPNLPRPAKPAQPPPVPSPVG